MPLPRALQKSLEEDLRNPDPLEHLVTGFNAGICLPPRVGKAIFAAQTNGVPRDKLTRDMLKAYFRITCRPAVPADDGLKRIKAQLYVGLEDQNNTICRALRDVDIPHYFQARLRQLNEQWEKRDRDALELQRRIAEIRDRKYASRAFPSTLKAIIFERDNYACRVCLRNSSTLQEVRLHLECDHVLEWEDGGLTTYDNGQTICSECNKAKHHSKRYLGLVARLRGKPV